MQGKRYTHVLWDFNGTVYDDVEACRRAVNGMLTSRGLPALSPEGYREVFDFPVKAYYAKAGFDFSVEPFEVLAPIWVAAYEVESRTCAVFPEVRETMARLRTKGIRQEILSATEQEMLGRQLYELNLLGEIDAYWGTGSIHASGKADLARAWRQANPDAIVLFIGDTTHDAAVAAAIGADCLLFDGGHMSRPRLEATGCPVISDWDAVDDLITW